MGGLGSGNWLPRDRKQTVEESLTVSISDLRRSGRHSGQLNWSIRESGQVHSLTWLVTGSRLIFLDGNHRDGFDLCVTPVNFGGHRWWIICTCGRRVGTVHLPVRGDSTRFACRTCHDLSYRSSQDAHKQERLFRQMKRLVESYELQEQFRG